MRYLKRLLICLYAFDGVFFTACLICNICGITIQDSLIAGVAAATGVESIIGGIIKIREAHDERNRMKLEHKFRMKLEHKFKEGNEDNNDYGNKF